MPAKTGSRNGLSYGWALGENNWNVGMDGNLSFIDRFGLHLSFKSFLNTPPASPSSGDCYVVDAAPTGAWVGKTGQVAVYDDGAWRYGLPRTGWLAYCEADDSLYVFDGAWAEVVSGGGGGAVGTLAKTDRSTPCLVKTGAGALAVKAGTTAYLSSGAVSFAAQTAITMPTLTAGEDYSVWVLPNGTAQAVADPFFAPASAPAAGALKIGGFHYGLVAPGTTVASGGFATTGTGMIWTQADVDLIAGIDAWSIWDLNYRPACPNQRGMARTVGGAWLDIYFCNTDVDVNGSSRYNTNVASGTVLPKKPLAFGGNGAAIYPYMTWWVASELAHAVGKRLPWEHEFVDAAFGVTEATAIGGASATIPATGRAAGFTSRIGIEQATGHIWAWGMDSGQAGETYSWQAITGGRGSTYTTPHRRVLLGGGRSDGSNAGSRCSYWSSAPSYSDWPIGLRAACDHYQGGY